MPMTTAMIRRPPIVGVPSFTTWLSGTLDADLLAEPDRLEQPDVGRHEDDHEGERQEEALDQLERHRRRILAELESTRHEPPAPRPGTP
jgi:hypothetical protein